MYDGLTLLETYLSDLEAEIARNRLTALGIRVLVQKDNCGGMRPHLELRGVRLYVPDDELDKARDILQAPPPAADEAAWTCPRCGEEIEGGFETCWQCGQDRV